MGENITKALKGASVFLGNFKSWLSPEVVVKRLEAK